MDENSNITALIQGYLDDRLTPAEYVELAAHLKEQPDNDAWAELLAEIGTHQPVEAGYDRTRWQPIIETITKPKTPVRRIAQILAAAAVAAALVGGVVLWKHHDEKPAASQPPVATDVAPGGDKAVLTLANGSTITLDSAASGTLAQQGAATVSKTGNGRLVYGKANGRGATEILYNKLATPRGGQYHLQLADGTVVWLNAASSIKYPTAFAGATRQVEVTGEAFFEVAKDKTRPFHVKANGVEVEVLGTSFDINAYEDESAIRTTLVDGSVKILSAASAKTLKPGEQAIVTSQLPIAVDEHANIEAVLAWKNGRFMFSNTPLPDALRQLARWYDVDVDIEGDLSKKLVWGKMQRDLNLSEVLEGLRYIGINYKIEGKKLTVMP